MTSNVIDDRDVDIRTADSIRASANNLAARDDSNVSRATTDIDNSRRVWLVCADAAAKRSRKSFFDDAHTTDVCMLCSTEQCTSLDRRHVGKHTHQRATTKMRQTAA